MVHPAPSPTLPRKRGRGHTECAALSLAKTQAVMGPILPLAKNCAVIGAKAAAALAKQRIGSPSGICYDSGEHLL
jgi:hypothetical protein